MGYSGSEEDYGYSSQYTDYAYAAYTYGAYTDDYDPNLKYASHQYSYVDYTSQSDYKSYYYSSNEPYDYSYLKTQVQDSQADSSVTTALLLTAAAGILVTRSGLSSKTAHA